MKIDRVLGHLFLAAMICACMSLPASASGQDAFTYQGQLKHSGDPVTGPVNLVFRLYDAEVGGTQVGSELTAFGFDAFDNDGRFTMDLAFGKGVFDGTSLWLEIEVDGVTLAPRQPIMPTPYSVRALNVAQVADGALTGTYTNELTMNNAGNQFIGAFAGSGAGLTGLNAGNISSGTLAMTRMPIGGSWNLSSNLNIGTGLMFLDNANSRVGIGTTNPLTDLHIGPSSGSAGLFMIGAGQPEGIMFGVGANGLAIGKQDADASNYQGLARLTFDGKFGIGTMSPQSNLEVRGSSSWPLWVTGANNAGIRIKSDSTASSWAIYHESSTDNLAFRDSTTGVTRMAITGDTGNVGIGTTAPSIQLHVQDGASGLGSFVNTDSKLLLEGSDTTWITLAAPPTATTGLLFARGNSNADGNLRYNPDRSMSFHTGGNIRQMTIDSGGNVGIGTTSPTEKLHVAGVVRTDGVRFADGSEMVAAPRPREIIEFASTGTFDWQCPEGVNGAIVEIWGAGGGGGGGANGPGTNTVCYNGDQPQAVQMGGSGGGSGAGGGYLRAVVNLTPGEIYAVFVGAGGAAGSAGPFGSDGQAGGMTKFGALVVPGSGGGGGGSYSDTCNTPGGHAGVSQEINHTGLKRTGRAGQSGRASTASVIPGGGCYCGVGPSINYSLPNGGAAYGGSFEFGGSNGGRGGRGSSYRSNSSFVELATSGTSGGNGYILVTTF